MFSLLSIAEEDFNHWNWPERSIAPHDLKFPTLALGDRMEFAQIAPESLHDPASSEIEARTSTLKYEPLFAVESEIRLLILHESSSKDSHRMYFTESQPRWRAAIFCTLICLGRSIGHIQCYCEWAYGTYKVHPFSRRYVISDRFMGGWSFGWMQYVSHKQPIRWEKKAAKGW